MLIMKFRVWLSLSGSHMAKLCFFRDRYHRIEDMAWDRYNVKGEKQIMDYLDSYGLDTGYLLSFSFNKTKERGMLERQNGNGE